MANKWTSEQLDAITQRGCNLLVAAAAGAGKTAVLVERIIRKITDSEKPVDIDRLLVVTFTNAAATEMRERIGNALAVALEKEPASDNLQRQMALLDRSSIMTIHSFCLEVVRGHFHSLGLDPAFRIADETESTLMKLEILDKLFEDKYENESEDSAFFKLVESYGGGRDDSSLRDTVLALHRFTRSSPWPEQWLAAQAEAYSPSASACLSSTPWARVLLSSAAAELQGLLALLEKTAARASRAQGLEPYCGVLADDMQQLQGLLEICTRALSAFDEMDKSLVDINNADSRDIEANMESINSEDKVDGADGAGGTCRASGKGRINGIAIDWDTIHEAFSAYQPARLPRCQKDADPEAQEDVKGIRSFVKDKVKKLCEGGFNESAEEIEADFRTIYPLFRYLAELVNEFDQSFSQKKQEKGLVDFNDLEHYCLRILIRDGIPTEAAEELRKKYEEILIDEYQDSNLIQELILGTVSGNKDGIHNVFMVGDVKQSIYRFRQAKPELFLSKYAAYPREKGFDSRAITLYKNFRSRAQVINGVNFIFRQIMSEIVGELDYTEKEALNPGAVFEEPEFKCQTGGPIELNIIDTTSEREEILPGEYVFNDVCEEGCSYNINDGNNKQQLNKHDISKLNDENESDKQYIKQCVSEPRADRRDTSKLKMDKPESSTDSSDEPEEEAIDNIQTEARIVGKRIQSLTSHSDSGLMVYDKISDGYRHAQYKDIVILMRATKGWADAFTDELAAMGIPAYADVGLGYFRTVEVETMLSLLQIIDNPMQDIPMLAVLRSPICGFSADELAEIRLADRNVSVYEAMKLLTGINMQDDCGDGCDMGGRADSEGSHEGSHEDSYDGTHEDVHNGSYEDSHEDVHNDTHNGSHEDSYWDTLKQQSGKDTDSWKCDEKVYARKDQKQYGNGINFKDSEDNLVNVKRKTADFLRKLWQWRDIAEFLPTDELVWQLMNETGYYSYVGVLPGGPERQANLRILFERARQYEETSYKGLFNFINFINKLKSSGGDMGSAKILGENDNVVRIMSIHKSKGLEFPVVFVAGCGKRFNLRDLNESILLHQDLGFGPDVVDLEKRTITSSLPKYAISRKLRLETLSEEMRILYVAFTRAKEKLILTGCVANIEKACAKWCRIADTHEEKLSYYDMQQAATYMDWLGPAVARHESALHIRMAAAPWGDLNTIKDDSSQWEVRMWGKGAALFEKEAAAADESIRYWLAAVDEQDEAQYNDNGSSVSIGRVSDGAKGVGNSLNQSKHGSNGLDSRDADRSLDKLECGPKGSECVDNYSNGINELECGSNGLDSRDADNGNELGSVVGTTESSKRIGHSYDKVKCSDCSLKDKAVRGVCYIDGLKSCRNDSDESVSCNCGANHTQKERVNKDELIRRLEWQYPGKRLTAVPAKLSVSELKRRFAAENDEEAEAPFTRQLAERPAFMEQEKVISAAGKGTIMHFVMQHLYLERLKAIKKVQEYGTREEGLLSAEIRSQIREMVDNEQLTELEAGTVKITGIVRFFNTHLGLRMLMSEVNRETAFNIQIKCSEIYKELSVGPFDNEVMLLQGVIDCWFRSDDGLVLLDYKTDYVPKDGAEIIRERYRVQLDYYTRALEKITGERVKERYLYLFYTGELISC